jgi:hypothetical protein
MAGPLVATDEEGKGTLQAPPGGPSRHRESKVPISR